MDDPKLFRSATGEIKPLLNDIEGISFQESPLDFFILLARYKFAARHIKSTHRVLDMGCGHGVGSVFLSRFAQEVVGADADSELIQDNRTRWSSRSNLTFKQIDLLRPPAEKYDVVVSMDVIEHFKTEQVSTVAENYARLTKKGGFAIIGTPNKASQPFASKRRLETHLHEFDPKEFQNLLEKSFSNVFLFTMTDEIVSTGFAPMAWYLMAICVNH